MTCVRINLRERNVLACFRFRYILSDSLLLCLYTIRYKDSCSCLSVLNIRRIESVVKIFSVVRLKGRWAVIESIFVEEALLLLFYLLSLFNILLFSFICLNIYSNILLLRSFDLTHI